MDKKYKELTGTTILFAGANIVSKLIKILLVPLYTYYMTTSEFGAAETMIITVNLLYPVFLLGVSEAALRFSMKKDDSAESIFSNCLAIVLMTSIAEIAAFVLLAFVPLFKDYAPVMYILTAAAAIEALLMAEAKGLGRNKVYAASEIVSAVILILSNVILLAVLRTGIVGYLWSIAAASAARIIFLSFRLRISSLIRPHAVSKEIIRSVLRFSLPFMPATILWWIMDSSGRYLVIWFMGASAAGIYSVAFRLSALVTSLSAVLHQAWTLSAIKQYGEGDYESFYKPAMTAYSMLFFGSASLLIAFVKPVMLFLDDSYNDAWKYAPALIIAAVFFALSGMVNANYTVCEKTAGVLWTSLAGAVISLASGLIMIPVMGMHGAAISAMISFYLMWLIMTVHTGRLLGIKHDYVMIHLNLVILLAETYSVLKQQGPLMTVICLAVLVIVNSRSIGKIHRIFRPPTR